VTTWGLVVRVGVGAAGVAIVLVSLLFLRDIGFPALWGAVMGGVLVVAALFEVGRYRSSTSGETSTPGGRFQRTDEVFVDPTTGVKTRVWFDPRSGERTYEPEP